MHTKNEVEILVDHITFTVGYEEIVLEMVDPEEQDTTERGVLERIREVFQLTGTEFIRRGGLYGYAIGWTSQNQVNICWGGNSDTIMIQFSGKGCRLYETLQRETGFYWLDFIRKIQGFRVHNISRLDIACDTFGSLDIYKIMKYTSEERYISRFKDHEVRWGNKIRETMFGSARSCVLLRIYDKTLEREQEVDDDVEVPKDWIRLEFQFRDKAADSFVSAWKSTGNISTAYFGITANQLRFVKKRESNLMRSETSGWWQKFLNYADKIPMAYQGGLEYNLQSLKRYVFGQAGSSIRTICELWDYDMDRLKEVVQSKKLNDRQENLLRIMKNVQTKEQ